MTDSALQSTKRELQKMFFAPQCWAALAAVALVLGMTGPFGTSEALPRLPRLAYWGAIVVATFFTGSAVVYLQEKLIWPNRRPGPAAFAIMGALAGIPLTAIVWFINWQALDDLSEPFSILVLLAYIVVISAVVSAIVAVFARRFATETAAVTAATPPQANAAEDPPRPSVLDRLPHHLRGRLLYMSMQDHYVDVHTDKGNTLVLMRLGDAIAETRGVPGLQIHRSHWIALDAVSGSQRRDGRLMMRMEDGALLPVSRTYLPAVREAGLA